MVNTYTTATLVEAEIRADSIFSTSTIPTLSQVTTWIQEASADIELAANQVFASTAVTSDYLDYDGDLVFRLPKAPLLSVDEIRYNQSTVNSTPSWLTLQAGEGYNYLTYLQEGEVEFIAGSNATNKIIPNPGKRKICASYTYGYTSTPLGVQHLATLMVAKRVIGTLVSSQANVEGGDIQVGTIRVSDPSNYSLSYLKSMNDEIRDLMGKLGLDTKVFRMGRVYD